MITEELITRLRLIHGCLIGSHTSSLTGEHHLENLITELQAKHNEALDLVSCMFSEDEVTKLLETQRINCEVAVMKYINDDEILEMIAKAPMHKYTKG